MTPDPPRPIKRSPDLRDLSVDHHFALLLARKAKLVAAGEEETTPEAMWREIEEKFRLDLEPHFAVEESALCPALEARGEREMVDRLLAEHRDLRAFVSPDGARTTARLADFGALLERHIRFEEREVFETAQKILSGEELRAVDDASKARRG